MDNRTKLVLEVESLVNSNGSSRLIAEEIVQLVADTLSGKRVAGSSNKKPWPQTVDASNLDDSPGNSFGTYQALKDL